MKKPILSSLFLFVAGNTMATSPSPTPPTPKMLNRTELAQVRSNFQIANRRLEQAKNELSQICKDQDRRLRNINHTLQGTSSDPGLLDRLQSDLERHKDSQEPFSTKLSEARNGAAALEFIEKNPGQPDKKRGEMVALNVVIAQLRAGKSSADRISELESKKSEIVTRIGTLDTEVATKTSEFNGWYTADKVALVEAAQNALLLRGRPTAPQAEALKKKEDHDRFLAYSSWLKLSLVAERDFYEVELGNLRATPQRLVSLSRRNSDLSVANNDLIDFREDIASNRREVEGLQSSIDDVNRRILRLTGGAGLTIHAICAQIAPSSN